MQSQYTRLTDDQWKIIKQFVDWQRNRELDLRDVFDAILYITRTGIQWRNLPFPNFPDWQAVYYYFDKWKKNGVIAQINLALNLLERLKNDRAAFPSLGLADSQSIKLAPMICEHRGLDGNKKINGRKRHMLVDTGGRIYQVHVHAANLHDSPEGVNLLKAPCAEGLDTIMADKTYRGTFADAVKQLGINFEVPDRAKGSKGFVVEAKRWVVERTFAWLNFYRRTVIDYEHTPESSAMFLLLANLSRCLEVI